MPILKRLRFLDAGESHGPKLTAILEGVPAGFPVDQAQIDADLARRQQGFGSGGRMQIERDTVRLSAGVVAGKTTGGPIAMEIANRDYANWRDKEIAPMTTPRPGHADLTGALKYGHGDLRLSLERASARETAMRVAVGGICRQILAAFGISVGGYVCSIGQVRATLDEIHAPADYLSRLGAARKSDLACPDPVASAAMGEEISAALRDKDTLGGVFEIVAVDSPPGLGSYTHWDQRLESRLCAALMSIQAVKGVEIGPAFVNAARRGTTVHDQISVSRQQRIGRKSNRAGGIEGGITTGEPIVIKAAMKPIATTLTPLGSVNLATFKPEATTYERSDICAVTRAVPVGEAMVAIVLGDALIEKLGGDSLIEMRPRFDALPSGERGDFSLENKPWRFGYDDRES